MSVSTCQAAPGSRSVPSCAPFWRKAGAVRLSHRADVASLWEGIAGEAAVASLRDGLGLPLPCYARCLAGLVLRHGGGRDSALLALRHARIKSRAAQDMTASGMVDGGNDSIDQLTLMRSEVGEIRRAWSTELAAGRCTILATETGSLDRKAARKVGNRLRRSRQGNLLFGTPTAADVLRHVAEAEIRRHLRKVRATVAPS